MFFGGQSSLQCLCSPITEGHRSAVSMNFKASKSPKPNDSDVQKPASFCCQFTSEKFVTRKLGYLQQGGFDDRFLLSARECLEKINLLIFLSILWFVFIEINGNYFFHQVENDVQTIL